MVELHVLLFDDMMVLLQKQDDKYVLKCQNTNVQPSRDEHKYTHTPVLRLQNLLARNLATDKKSFFVVNISEVRAQMYEFTANTSDLRIKWCKLINEKAAELKKGTTVGRAYSFMQAPQLEQIEMERNRLLQKTSSLHNPSTDSLVTSEEDMGLIQPEEVRVSGAIISEPTPVHSPLAALSPLETAPSEGENDSNVSSSTGADSTDGAAPGSRQPLSPSSTGSASQAKASSPGTGPVAMDQLKAMAAEMNTILTKLMSAMHSGSEERHQLRKELEEAQQKLNQLKEIQRQMTVSGAVPSGRLSPHLPVSTNRSPEKRASSTATDTGPTDIPEPKADDTSAAPAADAKPLEVKVTEHQSEEDVKEQAMLSSPGGPGQAQGVSQQVEISAEPSELSASMAEVVGAAAAQEVHTGEEVSAEMELSSGQVHEATVVQLEESVESLAEREQVLQVLQAVATETQAGESMQQEGEEEEEEMAGGSGSNVFEVAMRDEDDINVDDDDDNEVSVADLPLPDLTSIPEMENSAAELESSRLLDAVDLDESDGDSDDNDTITSKTSLQDFPSLSTTVEDTVGEEREKLKEGEEGCERTLTDADAGVDTSSDAVTVPGGSSTDDSSTSVDPNVDVKTEGGEGSGMGESHT